MRYNEWRLTYGSGGIGCRIPSHSKTYILDTCSFTNGAIFMVPRLNLCGDSIFTLHLGPFGRRCVPLNLKANKNVSWVLAPTNEKISPNDVTWELDTLYSILGLISLSVWDYDLAGDALPPSNTNHSSTKHHTMCNRLKIRGKHHAKVMNCTITRHKCNRILAPAQIQ